MAHSLVLDSPPLPLSKPPPTVGFYCGPIFSPGLLKLETNFPFWATCSTSLCSAHTTPGELSWQREGLHSTLLPSLGISQQFYMLCLDSTDEQVYCSRDVYPKTWWVILVVFYSLVWRWRDALSEPRMHWCFCFPVPQELSLNVCILINLECGILCEFYPQI